MVYCSVTSRRARLLLGIALPLLGVFSLSPVGLVENSGANASDVVGNQQTAQIQLLQEKQLQLSADTASLLKRLVVERANLLEEMRKQVRATMEEWENDPDYLNGQGLKAALFNAEAVAEGFGLDVEHLNKMYLASKKMILGLEMTGRCGEGSPQLDAIGDAVENVSETAKGAMEVFGLAASEEERMACVQTEKLKLYREVNRAYIYALTAESAAISAEGFRRYAGLISNIAGSDSAFLADQAVKMAETQDTVMIAFELTPVVGDLIELYRFGTGTDVLGGKISEFDRVLTGVLLFTPEVVEQLFKRYPKIFDSMKSFIKELVYPAGGFFDSAIIRSGQELSSIKRKAGEIWAQMLTLEKELLERIDGKVRDVVSENVDAIWKRLESMPGARRTQIMAIDASNMITPHVEAMREVAKKRGEILMFRPFNPLGKKAMADVIERAKLEGGRLATKWMDVKPKSSSNPILGAAIPVNPRLSKFDDALREARASGDAAALAKVEDDIEEMLTTVQELFAKTDGKGNPLVTQIPAQHINPNGDAVDILWAPDGAGNPVMGILNDAGDIVDPKTMRSLGADASRAERVMIIADPSSAKILPDYDMFAVGSKARANDPTVLNKGERFNSSLTANDPYGHNREVLDKRGNVVNQESVFTESLGGLNRNNLDVMTDVNEAVYRKSGVKGDVVHHGPANFWKEAPDYPVTVFMPNGDVKSILQGPANDPDKWSKEFFHALKQEGYSGFNPHPDWGWPAYNPRHGYKTMDEVARDAAGGAR